MIGGVYVSIHPYWSSIKGVHSPHMSVWLNVNVSFRKFKLATEANLIKTGFRIEKYGHALPEINTHVIAFT